MNKVKETLLKMQQWQKIVAIAGVFVFAVIVVILLYMNQSSNMIMIASNLSDSNRQAIESELNKLGVYDYELTSENSIAVPEDRATWIRTALSDVGLLSNLEDADEILLNSSLGESSAAQKNRKLIATRTSIENQIITSYTSVEGANAQIMLPESSSIFSDTESKGAATVTLQMKTGQSLTNSQIKGIQSMVSAAIDGIQADEVTIVDTQFGIISGTDATTTAAEGTTQYEQQVEIQNQIAETLKTNIEQTLSGMFTSSQYRINMNVDVDFDEVQRQITTYGDEGTLRSEQSERSSSSTAETAEDAAGIESNGEVPNYDAIDGDATTYSQESENTIRNYEIDETVEQLIQSPNLRRTNVVVWVDEDTLNAKNVNIDDFANAIALAVGLEIDEEGNFGNGEVSVMPITFLTDDVVEEDDPVEETSISTWLGVAIGTGILTVVGIIIFIIINKRKKQQEAEMEDLFAENDSFEEMVTVGEQEQILADEVEIELAEKQLVPNKERIDVEAKLTEAVKEDKEKAATIIKRWINEGEGG